MNIPNMLTMSRLGMAAILMALLSVSFPFTKSLALIVFVVAGITDWLDGYLARNVYGVTSFGKLMDPLTDKVLVCAAFVSFVELRLLPAWIVVVIISREFLVTGLRLLAASKGKVISAGKWGKHKTVWQILAISVLLLGLAIQQDALRLGDPCLLERYTFAFGYISFAIGIGVVMITVASGMMYFVENRDLIRKHIK
ncbi:MAG: CDP-diacylglycerol--glycerol-3-phosphate 3-phosphatidyltransferase [Spartobacteria bacterium]|nr:CDP-diacylglycerol--glycerol-3-phosphate 3-phosphatidyltransferase [Spartobacteria bacterium]